MLTGAGLTNNPNLYLTAISSRQPLAANAPQTGPDMRSGNPLLADAAMRSGAASAKQGAHFHRATVAAAAPRIGAGVPPGNALLFDAAIRSGFVPANQEAHFRQFGACDPQGFHTYLEACRKYKAGKG